MVTAIPHHLRRRHPVGTMSLLLAHRRHPAAGLLSAGLSFCFCWPCFLLFLFLVVRNLLHVEVRVDLSPAHFRVVSCLFLFHLKLCLAIDHGVWLVLAG